MNVVTAPRASARIAFRRLGVALACATLLAACSPGNTVDPLPGGDGAAVIAGSVRELSGAPGAGVPVTLEAMVDGQTASVRAALQGAGRTPVAPASATGFAPASDVRVTTTDAAGRFAFAGVSAGGYLVTAQSRDHLAGTARIDVPVTAAETTFVNLRITPTGTFSGQVLLDGETNHGGSVVYVDGTSYIAISDATGGWVMRQVPTGTHTLVAAHDAFVSGTLPGTLTAAGDSVDVGSKTLYRDRNLAPTATASASGLCPDLGPVQLGGSGADLDGTIARYEWDFEDDGLIDYTSPSSPATTHAYAEGTHRARLSVRDDQGAYGYAVVQFTVGGAQLYVSPTGADTNPGTAAAPFQTLAKALAVAPTLGSPCRPIIFVATGVYGETPTFPSNVDVRGGYDGVTWLRQPGAFSEFSVGSAGAQIVAQANVQLDGLRFVAAPGGAPGASSMACVVRNSTIGIGFNLCSFVANNGSPGIAGVNGTAGLDGLIGSNGQNGTSAGSGGGAGGSGGPGGGGGPTNAGGPGGTGGYNATGAPGVNGVGACPGFGGNGGALAICLVESAPGGNGTAGCAGFNGVPGAAAAAGSFSPLGWVPGNGGGGSAGSSGSGGGGGGGGGGGAGGLCNPDRGGGGGGGGGGGVAGAPGGGGGGGGASIALFFSNSLGAVTNCTFQSGQGGAGASGGNGGGRGLGAGGGGGGFGPDDSGNGGPGGPGGNSGFSGPGAGGAGGASWCVAWTPAGSAPTLSGATYTAGPGGPGGPGGSSSIGSGPSGPAGPSGSTHGAAPAVIEAASRAPVASRTR